MVYEMELCDPETGEVHYFVDVSLGDLERQVDRWLGVETDADGRELSIVAA